MKNSYDISNYIVAIFYVRKSHTAEFFTKDKEVFWANED